MDDEALFQRQETVTPEVIAAAMREGRRLRILVHGARRMARRAEARGAPHAPGRPER
jgi:hypothetical protein